jgi:hypothetical protein
MKNNGNTMSLVANEENKIKEDFLAWGRENGLSKHISDYLESRDDLGKATPKAWLELSKLGESPEFMSLKAFERRDVTRGIIGHDALMLYSEWVLKRWQAENKDMGDDTVKMYSEWAHKWWQTENVKSTLLESNE